jgi:hypothetical protein
MRLARAPASVFYHGGVAGLAAGAFILPGGLVKPDSPGDDWYSLSDNQFCFVTIDLFQAWCSALYCEDECGAAEVYRVRPIGRLWHDLDESGTNFACRRALIVGRYRVPDWVRAAWRSDQFAFMEDVYAWWGV